MPISTIGEFLERQKLTATEMNALRAAINTIVAGGLEGTNISWPLIADGNLDMNGFDILNMGTADGVYHVNDGLTLATAVSSVNSAGSGVIVVDPGFTAETTTAGLTITASNVTLRGYGESSKINFSNTATATAGITVTGDNFRCYDLYFTTSGSVTEGIKLEAVDSADIRGCKFYCPSVSHVVVGDAASGQCARVNIHANSFIGSAGTGVVVSHVDGCGISLNNFNYGMTRSVEVYTGAAALCRSVLINGNRIFSSLYAVAPSASSSYYRLAVEDNMLYSGATATITNVLNLNFQGNTLEASAVGITGCVESTFQGNIGAYSVDFDVCVDVDVSANSIDGYLTVGGTCTRLSVTGNRLLLGFSATSGQGISTFIGNTIVGNLSGVSYLEDPTECQSFGLNTVTGTVS